MKDDLFNDLIASVREGGAILRGESLPSRTNTVNEMGRVSGTDAWIYATRGKPTYGGGGGKKRRPSCRQQARTLLLALILIIIFVGAAVLIAYLNVR